MLGTRRSISRLIAWTLLLLAWAAPSVFSPTFAADPTSSLPPPLAVDASRQSKNPVVISVRGGIDSVTARSVRRRLDEAVALGADAIVLEIDSPGGELGAVLEISNLLKNSPIRNTVAWINPNAYSGGAIIALACREIIVAGSIGFGDAKVIRPVFDRNSLSMQLRGMNNDERQKLLPPLLADVIDSARRHNRAVGAYRWDELLVQAIVATDAELWWVEDTKTNTRFAVDRAEFERLFPDRPVLQPIVATASVGSNEKATSSAGSSSASAAPAPAPSPSPTASPPPPASPDSGPDKPVFESTRAASAAPSLRDLDTKIDQALDLAGGVPSLRPRTVPEASGRYRLLAKISNGDGAIVLREREMAYFQLASNTRLTPAGTELAPVNSDADLKAFMGASSLTRLDESWSESLARFMSSTPVRGLLITVFLVCLFIEFLSPGVTLPGIIALCCLAGLFVPPLLVGMSMWWQLGAILLGILFLGAELFVLPGFGVAGVLGIAAILVGMIGVFIPGSSGVGSTAAQFRSGLATGVLTILLSAATTIVVLYFVYRNLGTIPLLRNLVLQDAQVELTNETSMLAAMSADELRVGDEGAALTPLRPSGKAEFRGRTHDVVAEMGMLDAGARVRVASVTPFRIGVEAIRDASPDAASQTQPQSPLQT